MARAKSATLLAAAAVFSFACAASPTRAQNDAGEPAPSYATLADLALAAPIAASVTVRDAVRLKDADAAGVAPGSVRFYTEGEVTALLAGAAGLPARVNWIADLPLGPSNRPPRLKKARFILLARQLPGKPDTLQLVSRAAMLPWSPELEMRVRALLTAKLAPDAPPAITGVGHAFHVAGSIPGEGETQVFLKTANGRPVSLSILRRPGEQPRWSVSLGEMVDDAASAPPRDTLLWYRLACGLPSALPDDAVADQAAEDADAARADYKLVLDGLGPCGHSPAQPGG